MYGKYTCFFENIKQKIFAFVCFDIMILRTLSQKPRLRLWLFPQLASFSLAPHPPPVRYRHLYVRITEPCERKCSHNSRSYEYEPLGQEEIVCSAKRKPEHKGDDNGMPEVDGVGKAGNGMENGIIKPFSNMFGAWRKEYHKRDRDGCERETVCTVEPGIIEISRLANVPQKYEQSSAHEGKQKIVP